jgi:hypothetical protein
MKVSRKEAERHAQAGRAVHFVPEAEGHRSRRVERRKAGVLSGLPADHEKGEFVLVYDELGNLTRAGMELTIREGGGVLVGNGADPENVVATSIDDLPSEESLAAGNADKTARLAADLDRQIADLEARKARLAAAGAAQPAPAAEAEEEEGKRRRHRREE